MQRHGRRNRGNREEDDEIPKLFRQQDSLGFTENNNNNTLGFSPIRGAHTEIRGRSNGIRESFMNIFKKQTIKKSTPGKDDEGFSS